MADIHTKNSPHAKKNYTFIGYTVDNSQSKRNISKNEEVEELKEQENSPENKQINKETSYPVMKRHERTLNVHCYMKKNKLKRPHTV